MSWTKKVFLLCAATMTVVNPAVSQTEDETKPSFEVASIKPNNSGVMQVAIGIQPGGRFVATGVPMVMLMNYAYRVRDFQIIGGPDWIRSDRWDVQARAEEGSVPQRTGPMDPGVSDQVALRVQSLLEERLQLKFHRETREFPVYELTIAKGGLKINLSEDQNPSKPPEEGEPAPPFKPGGPLPRGSMMVGAGKIEANGIEFSQIVQLLSQQLRRTVIDRTGLKGRYDVKLEWTPEMGQGPLRPPPPGMAAPPPPDPSGPSIFTALQEQLGLKVDSAKGPVEVIVIDGVQKPSED